MDYIGIFKAAEDVYDGVDVPDMGQEFVAESLALRGAAYQACDIDEFDHRGSVQFRRIHFRQNVEPLIGNAHHTDVRVDRTERIVRALRPGSCQRVEQRTFSHVRETDYSEFHICDLPSIQLFFIKLF